MDPSTIKQKKRGGQHMKKLMIAGTGSGVGKTTVTLGIMAALKRRGLKVQGFKCGPDYIDPTYHTAVTGRLSRNLDGWMAGKDAVQEIFVHASSDADISIIEGVMGFYDGRDPLSNEGSSAEVSLLLDCPVLLVINCRSMARSAAAIVKGFQLLEPGVNIAAVFANHVGSKGHYQLVKKAVEKECGVPVVGYMTREEEVCIPERHLGLIPSVERGELAPLFGKLADCMELGLDMDRLLSLSESAPVNTDRNDRIHLYAPKPQVGEGLVIAVAKDAAFHFYYPENLELLEAYGAKCVYFSPLNNEPVPAEASGLILGGGYPEEFAITLAGNVVTMRSIRKGILSGMPTIAECGGYMYLAKEIVNTQGDSYPMVGLLPAKVIMQNRLATLGYREISGWGQHELLPEGETAKGHEFHYSTLHVEEGAEWTPNVKVKGKGGEFSPEGVRLQSLFAGYTHMHFASNEEIVPRWLGLCRRFEKNRERVENRSKA
ncbi:cobyrinic acid a,c-diamide synthase [Paenibacillus larvae subsp. pulvifaciens]|uniref:Cobyrinate a,c-diamide synthase n=3 Tax=Paenibacillus larvae TaxID=1464 RepID=A0A1V0UQM3_9BACL|nr:cobyrinate a,c-diamide synthase [Paenibacillus larvae]ARF67583.1 cobyrinic acid a,c-diamide synthase [Paenibacillus larvae subsp. pulvifaciens]